MLETDIVKQKIASGKRELQQQRPSAQTFLLTRLRGCTHAHVAIISSLQMNRIVWNHLQTYWHLVFFTKSCENLLVRAELPSLLNRRLQDIAILMYKVKYGLAPSIVNELFKRKSTSYSLRNSDFDIPTFNTINYGKHSLRYQGPHMWSKLDIKLKGSSNIESFKKNIRKKDQMSLLNNNSCCNLCNSYRLPFIYRLSYYTIYTCYIF